MATAQQPMQPDVVEDTPVVQDQPIPMSFPALLRSGRNPQFAYLQQERLPLKADRSKRNLSKQGNEGKRWLRRRENAQFTFNPHIIAPSGRDLDATPNAARSTFPAPLPSYLPRTSSAPDTSAPTSDPLSATAGLYSMSLRGVRRVLRKAGPRAEAMVHLIEEELQDWLSGAPIITAKASSREPDGKRRIGTTGSIFEVSRNPAQLVWNIEDDAFTRYIVHATARFYGIVSFSKDEPVRQTRLTHLLRPNVTRPNVFGLSSMVTPPITDLDSASDFIISDRDLPTDMSDLESELGPFTEEEPSVVALQRPQRSRLGDNFVDLSAISSDEGEFRRDASAGHADAEVSEDDELPIASLTLDDTTPRPAARTTDRFNTLRTQLRSGSSPSRSPSRRFRSRRAAPFSSTCTQDLKSYPARSMRSSPQSSTSFSTFLFG